MNFNDHPDPHTRLDAWRTLARQHISLETCERLTQFGMPELAVEFMRLRGDIA